MDFTMDFTYKKYINGDGKVAVLMTNGYGAGWTTANSHNRRIQEKLLFDSRLVELVLAGLRHMITSNYLTDLFGTFYDNVDIDNEGFPHLVVDWVDAGDVFYITEHDGFEEIVFLNSENDYFRA